MLLAISAAIVSDLSPLRKVINYRLRVPAKLIIMQIFAIITLQQKQSHYAVAVAGH